MADPKTYLNVPFGQKDEAKALGARWDAIQKKWFVPAGKNTTLFAKWQTGSTVAQVTKPKTTPKAVAVGVRTHATIKGFAAYNGDTPPWD